MTIRLLNGIKIRSIEIYREIKEIYGKSVMNEASVNKWCIMFNEDQMNVHNDE